MCPSYANAQNIGEISEETSAMTLPVNTRLAGSLPCSIYFVLIMKLKHNTLLEEYIIFESKLVSPCIKVLTIYSPGYARYACYRKTIYTPLQNSSIYH